jgi:hypothetical protein
MDILNLILVIAAVVVVVFLVILAGAEMMIQNGSERPTFVKFLLLPFAVIFAGAFWLTGAILDRKTKRKK